MYVITLLMYLVSILSYPVKDRDIIIEVNSIMVIIYGEKRNIKRKIKISKNFSHYLIIGFFSASSLDFILRFIFIIYQQMLESLLYSLHRNNIHFRLNFFWNFF